VKWFAENYKWLFDGVGGAAVLAIIGYMIHRYRRSGGRKGSAVLTAQSAKVVNSPVASGSGITQTINSPTINLSLPEATAPSTPLRFFNFDGTSGPLNVSGKQHSAQDRSIVDLWCLVTIVNYTHYPMKIEPRGLFLNGAEWPFQKVLLRPRSNPLDKFTRISLRGNDKEDYELHFMFSLANYPQARSGYIVMETDTGDAVEVEVRFP
jgi:hypothetical protein